MSFSPSNLSVLIFMLAVIYFVGSKMSARRGAETPLAKTFRIGMAVVIFILTVVYFYMRFVAS